MFRKDPDAIQYWSKTILLSDRSCKILGSILKCLHPNGQLIYSTCTWSPEENEDIVRWLLEQYTLELIDIPEMQNGMVEGMAILRRMYPHRFKGEGQFVAKFRYKGKVQKFGKSNLNREQQQLWQSFQTRTPDNTIYGVLQSVWRIISIYYLKNFLIYLKLKLHVMVYIWVCLRKAL